MAHDPNPTPLRRLAPWLAFIILVAGLAALVPAGLVPARFLEWENGRELLGRGIVLCVAAMGLLMVMAQRGTPSGGSGGAGGAPGIDLSIPAVMGLAGVVTAKVLGAEVGEGDLAIPRTEGNPLSWPVLAMALGVLVGGACGLLNGGLIALLRAPAFLITLTTLLIARGVATGLSRGRAVFPPMTWVDQIMQPIWPGACLAGLIAAGVVLRMRRGGGLRLEARGARDSALGLDSQRLKPQASSLKSMTNASPALRTLVIRAWSFISRHWSFVLGHWSFVLNYVIAGLLAGVAGVLAFSLDGGVAPGGPHGRELELVAAVLIGGGSLWGGRASVIATLGGVFLLVTIGNGLAALEAPEWLRLTAAGAIVLAAVGLDRWRRG